MALKDFLKNGKFFIWDETFAIIKAKRTYPDSFANIIDKNEITVITNQGRLDKKDILEIENNYKILTFDMVLPFGLVGFLAAVFKEFAEADISVFPVSAYSTDHILIKEEDLGKAVEILTKLGFTKT
jgi:hypothetical protein